MYQKHTRRQFLTNSLFAASAMSIVSDAGAEAPQKPKPKQLKLGLAAYTFRKFSLEQTLDFARKLDLKYICLKDFHLPLNSTEEQIKQVEEAVKKADIELYACGVIYMKTDEEVSQAFDYAKSAGMKMIIAGPNYELLELVNKKVQQYDIKLAIHNHGPGDKLYPTPDIVYEKIKFLDKRIGLCIDVGHTVRAGAEPAEAAKKFADRLLDVHIKDVSAAAKEGKTVETGRGIIDIPRLIKTLLKTGYDGIASFEYEKDPENPLAGLAESVGYIRGVLASF